MKTELMQTEIPPTAGLALIWQDFIHHKNLRLSDEIAKLLQIPTPAETCSGTVAFILSLEVLYELKPNKNQIIVPAWTCPLVILAIEKIGLIPKICDLNINALTLDPLSLQQLINDSTLAIVITHYGGLVNSFQNCEILAREYDCFLIEDSAQAMGAFNKNQSVGLRGDIGFFSLAFGKGLTSAEGGLAFSKHPEIHLRIHQKASQLPTINKWEIQRCIELWGYYFFYRPQFLSYFYGQQLRKNLQKNDEISAVGDNFSLDDIPIHSLGKWRSKVAAKASIRLTDYWNFLREQAETRIKQLQLISYLYVFEAQENTHATFPFLIILVDHPMRCQKILDDLWQSGLGITKLFVRAIPEYPNLTHLNYKTPNAQDFASRCFTITNTHWLSNEIFQHILQTLKKHESF